MAKPIMIQGTMSNAGKSLLAAGLCRIFRQDGYRVAPFKSQNMALNSFVTGDGLEMGRAQVMQAEAAGILPDVRMNPILLKPTTDTGSQVIVMGEVLGDMDARQYFARKKSLLPVALEAYRSLAEENDVIVIEGAGSPAEINLKKDDIVNMGLARAVGAPVLLAGDIDRGGVFAQLLGTQMLLDPDEQALLKGMIINKFRGDKTLVDSGVRMLEERSGLPVVGVVPYMQLDLDDEDSLSPQLDRTNRPPAGKPVEIAVIRLPHLSNFTDFNVFSRIPEADLRYVSRPEAMCRPDMIILPGTKNTLGDLRWLKESGMAAAVQECFGRGSVLFGICGGFQMLGRTISDPDCTEEGGIAEGLGFLDAETVFGKEKRRTLVYGRIGALTGVLSPLGGMEIEGYEIHMGSTRNAGSGEENYAGSARNAGSGEENNAGSMRNAGSGEENYAGSMRTRGSDPKNQMGSARIRGSRGKLTDAPAQSPFSIVTDRVSGGMNPDGLAGENVYGTYVHGIFDAPGIARSCVQALADRKGISIFTREISETMDPRAYKDAQYDLLADTLRRHLDMKKIYGILRKGV